MKAFLMHRDSDFEFERKIGPHEQTLIQDLQLSTLFSVMARSDNVLLEVAKKAVLYSLTDPDAIRYRQEVLRDCLNNPSIVREIYGVAVRSIEKERENYFGILSRYPAAILRRSTEVLRMFLIMLGKIREIADEYSGIFDSEGFKGFFDMLKRELNDEFFDRAKGLLGEMKSRHGVLISAELGEGNKGASYVLRKSSKKRGWLDRIFSEAPPSYSFQLHPRDESGAEALSRLNARGINPIANAFAQAADHILSFFTILSLELGFYIGCLNLHERLKRIGSIVCFPVPAASVERRQSFRGLYDPCLVLNLEQTVVSNDGNADNKEIVIITGPNQGGKSTFLRSIGVSQLLMQCGMFVPAEFFSANICQSLFTHYKREEDTTMKSGKLDEELSRMSDIADNLRPDSMLLLSESFAATNDREGSEIARQIVLALLEMRVKVFFVTHLYGFPSEFYEKRNNNMLFLRAERQSDGRRTFKLIEGEPLQTSYGEDLYYRIFEQ